MCDDRDKEIPCAQTDHSPNQSVPYGDPVEILKSIHHEGIECKYQRTGEKGERRKTLDEAGVPQLRLKCSQTSEKKAAKIHFHKEGDATDEPGEHDEERKSAMQCVLEKVMS